MRVRTWARYLIEGLPWRVEVTVALGVGWSLHVHEVRVSSHVGGPLPPAALRAFRFSDVLAWAAEEMAEPIDYASLVDVPGGYSPADAKRAPGLPPADVVHRLARGRSKSQLAVEQGVAHAADVYARLSQLPDDQRPEDLIEAVAQEVSVSRVTAWRYLIRGGVIKKHERSTS